LVNVHGQKATADLGFVAGARHGAVLGRAVDVEGVINISLFVVTPALAAVLGRSGAANDERGRGRETQNGLNDGEDGIACTATVSQPSKWD